MKKLVMLALVAGTCIPMKIVAVHEFDGYFGRTIYEYVANDWNTGREGKSAQYTTYKPVQVGQDVCIPWSTPEERRQAPANIKVQ